MGGTPLFIQKGKGSHIWDADGNEFIDAQKKGILFDVGHGGGAFFWRQAIPAIKQGFKPDVISTDLHSDSMNGGMKDCLLYTSDAADE